MLRNLANAVSCSIVLGLVLALPAACSTTDAGPEGPRCGDGKLDATETPETCCQDAGCTRGVCDPGSGACVDPWVLDCAGIAEGSCANAKPYVCMGDAPPAYDCATCGCPGSEVCEGGVCYPPETLASKRDGRTIPQDLPVDDYFRFMDEMATSQALTLSELDADVARKMREDRRRAVLNLGESHGSDDEQAVGVHLVRAVLEAGFTANRIGIEGGDSPILDPEKLAGLSVTPMPIEGDLTNKAYCKAAATQVGEKLSDEGIYVQYSGSGHTSQEACYHPEHYSICLPPHTAECVAQAGRKAITVMLFDPDPWLTMTDHTLLYRAAAALPDPEAFGAELETILTRWSEHLGKQLLEPRLEASAEGRQVNVRIVRSPRLSDVYVAFFPRPARPAFLMRSFKAVWDTPALRAFLVAEGMGPKNCSISWDRTPGAESYHVLCTKDAKELSADLDARFNVTASSTN